MKKQALLFLLLLINPFGLLAQEIEMADRFRADGKIYVVVAIVLIILIGLFAYLFLLDKKVSNLEKRMRDQQTK
jgi:CcmD family protein